MPRVVAARADALPVLAEVFREHGFEGASLSIISRQTGLGKGSLYHFFPGGKEEMAAAVLDEIRTWFNDNIFGPLGDKNDPRRAIENMFRAVEAYFHSGNRVCLIGVFALSEIRDRFAIEVRLYFSTWTTTLASALVRAGVRRPAARALAEEAVTGIQGALVLARALNDPAVFARSLTRLRARLADV